MVVLASQSPRRRELLETAGIPFALRVSGVPEVPGIEERPEDYVCRLAREKALAVDAAADEYVLAADTVVVVDAHMLEKPASPEDAARMLRLLSGRWHQVMTGVCVLHLGQAQADLEVTSVRFAALSSLEIADYVGSGEPFDKAGGYAIQGRASRYIDRIEGCYFNVVGLPMALVYRMLARMGYPFFPPA